MSWFIQNLSSLFLNELRDGTLTISDGAVFHILTILQLKRFQHYLVFIDGDVESGCVVD